ncbi:MAG TPA: MBL fold metallo-hydrolase [Pirellulales bacterium]|nr:MBL fold metallo-hydrolase [Pirellulales bacterium]
MKELVQVEAALGGLYASAPQPLPFDPSLDIRAFLLHRKHGNLLVYSADTLTSDAMAVRDLGGIARRYFNHWHEAMVAPDRIDAPVYCHEKDRESVAAKTRVHGTFANRHVLDDDFEVIPTPGHTSGTTTFLWNSEGHRFLFTSDTIYLREGEWVATVLGESDRTSYIKSLELIRDLDFDVLVPWAATRGQPYCAKTDRSDARRRIGAILDRVRRGEDQ